MGLETFGFGFGREDVWEPEEIFWGPEDTWLGDERYAGERELEENLGAVQMGLIYVNPEGPNGNPDPLASARDIRDTFARMAMNDEETVALIAGGHTFGKTHGAGDPTSSVPSRRVRRWRSRAWAGAAATARARARTPSPRASRSPGPALPCSGATTTSSSSSPTSGSWRRAPREPTSGSRRTPRRSSPARRRTRRSVVPTMLTSDLALRVDPAYEKISRRFKDNPEEFGQAFAKAWYKLLHRDMGPVSRFLGPWVAEPQLWQDPVPAVAGELVSDADVADLKTRVLDTGLSVSELVGAAWASAATFRSTDKRGGANGARIRLEPQRGWAVNQGVDRVLEVLEDVQRDFNAAGGAQVSLADLIVLAGSAAVEKAAADAGVEASVPFHAGRTDASQEDTDVDSFSVLEPRADGFRNYLRAGEKQQPEKLLVDRAYMLDLTAPEMTVLVGGLRALGVTASGTGHGVLTDRAGSLTNDFFVNLLTTGTQWKASESEENVYEIRDLASGEKRWTATPVDLIFGSNSRLRALAEVYASDDAREKLVRDFVAAWTKVMDLDRFDLR